MIVNRLVLSGIILSFLILSCNINKHASKQPTVLQDEILITLEKTPCYGECPVFKIDIYGNGKIVYEGKQFTSKTGTFVNNISEADLKSLTKQFNDAGFFDLEDEYTSDITDFPTTYISFTFEGKSKKIRDYYGAPEKLKLLENEVERFSNLENWEKIKD